MLQQLQWCCDTAIAGQVKLREIETLAGEAENPNIIRTAVSGAPSFVAALVMTITLITKARLW